MAKRPSIHHVAVVVQDLERALAFYRDALGLEVTERCEVPDEGVEVASLTLGTSEIELLRPTDEESGVARFLAKRGEGLHHICLTVEDVEAAMEQLRDAGAEVLGDEPRVNAEGRRYIFVHPKSAHGVLLELYEKRG